MGRASLIKLHPHPTYTYTTYLLSQQYFLCSQTGAHLAALPAGTVLMSLSGARKISICLPQIDGQEALHWVLII